MRYCFLIIGLIFVLALSYEAWQPVDNRVWGSYEMTSHSAKQQYFTTLYQSDSTTILLNNLEGQGLVAVGQIHDDLITFEPQQLNTSRGGSMYFHGHISLEYGRYVFDFVPTYDQQLAETRVGNIVRL